MFLYTRRGWRFRDWVHIIASFLCQIVITCNYKDEEAEVIEATIMSRGLFGMKIESRIAHHAFSTRSAHSAVV